MRALLALMLLPGMVMAESETTTRCKDTIAALDIVHVRVEEARIVAGVKQSVIELCQKSIKTEEELDALQKEKAKAKEEEKE